MILQPKHSRKKKAERVLKKTNVSVRKEAILGGMTPVYLHQAKKNFFFAQAAIQF